MKKASVPEESIIKITGHSNPAGLRSYDEGDEDEFRRLSHAIHGRPTAIASTSQSRQRIQLQILARLLVQTSS